MCGDDISPDTGDTGDCAGSLVGQNVTTCGKQHHYKWKPLFKEEIKKKYSLGMLLPMNPNIKIAGGATKITQFRNKSPWKIVVTDPNMYGGAATASAEPRVMQLDNVRKIAKTCF